MLSVACAPAPPAGDAAGLSPHIGEAQWREDGGMLAIAPVAEAASADYEEGGDEDHHDHGNADHGGDRIVGRKSGGGGEGGGFDGCRGQRLR